ncbi:MAG: hypothetical protein HYV63_22685 [Candidatus Schekmanbacteria bacterium]|nr:hypothetical protein [Candidatus Schekmanbacteria bacterium]
MQVRTFQASKAGAARHENEDSVDLRRRSPGELGIVLADGASTGVFSKGWSAHLAATFGEHLDCALESFDAVLELARATFSPDLSRHTALRKFLTEGSFATLLAARVELVQDAGRGGERSYALTMAAVGDACLIALDADGSCVLAFPCVSAADFGNTPNLIRSSAKLQERTPYRRQNARSPVRGTCTLLAATDAFAELVVRKVACRQSGELLRRLLECEEEARFAALVAELRRDHGMKNDDVSIVLIQDGGDA